MKRKNKLTPKHRKAMADFIAAHADLFCETEEEKAVFLYVLDETVGKGKIEARINLADLEAHVTRRLQEQGYSPGQTPEKM